MTSSTETPDAAHLEIVELSNGEVVLRTADQERRPIVTIQFSQEARDFLGRSIGEIGKAMIGTGVQMAGEIYQDDVTEEDLEPSRILH